jgi:hypothetical protein
MAGWMELFRGIGQAVRERGLRALMGLMPFGEALYDLAAGTWEYLRGKPEADPRAMAEQVAQASPAEVKKVAQQVAHEVAADQPVEVRLKLVSYLEQVPGAIRQSLRRPSDPSGTTLSPRFSLQRIEDCLQLLPARLPRFQPGDRPSGVGDWELVEMLGTGGFGEVWKARHIHFDGIAPVALKFCLDPAARSRLLQHEARVLNQVMKAGRHPGIVSLLDASLNAEPPCLRYELIEGGDLSVLIREGLEHSSDRPAWRQATDLVRQLAEIVGYAHRLNPPIVHRDLKPANILVARGPDGTYHLHVTDFGIGGIVAETTPTHTRTGPTVVRGAHTPLYASPQQMHGDAPDPRDDVHALGVIWYQLLTSDLNTGTPTGLWADDLEEQGMPRDLVRLLGACVASKSEKRPPDAAELAGKLAALLASEVRPAAVRPKPVPVEVKPEPTTPAIPENGTVAALLRQVEHNPFAWMLDLTNRQIGDEGLAALAAAPQLAKVSVLILSGNLLSDAGVKTLAASPYVENLARLVLWDNRIGDDGVSALAACPRLVNLTTLDIGSNRVGDRGVQALAASPYLNNLTALILVSNQIGDDGARALVASKTLTNLAELKLLVNRIGPPGVVALQRHFGKRVRIY